MLFVDFRSLYSIILCVPLGDSVVTGCGMMVLTIRSAALSEEDGEVSVVPKTGVFEGVEGDPEKKATKS